MKRTEVDVGEVVAEAAALLRSGADLQQAWAQTLGRQPADSPWAEAGYEIAQGLAVDEALRGLAKRVKHPEAVLGAAAGCALAQRIGSSAADVLDECVQTATELQTATADRKAAVAGPRSTMRVLLVLPVIALFLFQGAGINAIATLVSTPAGWTCLIAGGALLYGGQRWVAKLITAAESGRLQ
ncbi:MAG TPA: hypothetical protein VK030_01910 [Actinomycetales bacterium]|nr:hypothetical protein [Actinomycetales bacterium]